MARFDHDLRDEIFTPRGNYDRIGTKARGTVSPRLRNIDTKLSLE